MVTLIADIGGTNIRLALVRKNEDYLLSLRRYKCSNFDSINSAVIQYMKDIGVTKIEKAVFAVAAAVQGDHIQFQNNKWQFSIKQLQQDLSLKELKVMNDFEAQAYGTLYFKKKDLFEIKKGFQNHDSENGRKLVLGCGTGLGLAALIPNGKDHLVFSSEAGHSIFGPYNDLEQEIFSYFRKVYCKESYPELFLSGQGIRNIYEAMCHIKGIFHDKSLYSKAIVNRYQSGNQGIYKDTMEVFFDLLGTFCSSVAMTFLPFGGIYLTGVILSSVKEDLLNSNFNNRYLTRNSNNIKNIVNKVPIFIVDNEDPGMLGLYESEIK